jgi:O-acetyl-ADP-ribose deacetylase (regulator of RNase III)
MGSTTSSNPSLPKIHLLLMEDKHVEAFNTARTNLKLPSNISIEIHNTSLYALPKSHSFTAIVSPANSFARLDGAFDDALSRAFAPKSDYHALTRVAQATLYEQWRGFAPPGTCTVVDMGEDGDGQKELRGTGLKKSSEVWGIRYLLLCPTMRVPMDVRWDREVVYECVWSLLNAVQNHNDQIMRDEEKVGEGEIKGEAEAEEGKEGGKARGRKIESFLMTPLATGCGAVSPQRWAEQTVLAIQHFADAVSGGSEGMWRGMQWKDAGRVSKQIGKTYGATARLIG